VKVLVATNMAPFVWGGAEQLATELTRQLARHGHQSELLRLPFQWEPAERIPSQMLLARYLELDGVDHVIAMKFPTYLVRHDRKSLWLVHQYRQAYDLHDAGLGNIAADASGDRLRELIRAADDEVFAEARSIYAISPGVRDRLQQYNSVESAVLRAPMLDRDLFTGGDPDEYIFVGGRVNAMKRQHLLIEAVAKADDAVRLVVAGPPDSPADHARVVETVERLGLEHRVQLDLRFLERETYASYVNAALAVAYAPFDEDSHGYVTMEAAEAAKPVITLSDSGGVLGLVRDGETGWVTEPDAEAIGAAYSEIWADRSGTRSRGAAARELWSQYRIDWDLVIELLLA
jgi:glycosyltransferase involved in cell wall biosynthesis